MQTPNAIRSEKAIDRWPALPLEAWKDTCDTLHLWTQIIGKVRMALTPFVNHWWHVSLYVTPRGLTTSSIPYHHGSSFSITFDFINHNLSILTSDGTSKTLPLIPRSVAAFYREFMACLRSLGIEVTINPWPCEVQHPIRLDEDEIHASYDPVYAYRFWLILVQTVDILQQYRSQFLGKSSPIHFFWGSFDLALTFFSGRRAPPRPDADRVTQEAYSHEVISCGFWPGDEHFPMPAFYSYTVPTPTGLEKASILPSTASYLPQLGEFVLRYDDMRSAASPEEELLKFYRSTYQAGATLTHWDREALERR
ncbi:MAG TPA: DUF5996 family protein [Ktedonobacteraceae bacterium]|nr:DUF5996 family protein [Ktedonobacteraceae bacterium]